MVEEGRRCVLEFETASEIEMEVAIVIENETEIAVEIGTEKAVPKAEKTLKRLKDSPCHYPDVVFCSVITFEVPVSLAAAAVTV